MSLAVTAWLIWRTYNYESAFGWALVGGLLASFHAYLHDCLLLLLAYALVYDTRVPWYVRAIFRVLALPFIYVALLFGWPFSAAVAISLLVCLVLGAISTFHPVESTAAA